MSSEERARIEREIRAGAARRVRTKLGFYWHLAVFLLANAAMVAINLSYTPEHRWFVWPLGGWGAALILHALATFQTTGVTQTMIEQEVQRELAKRGLS